MDMEQQVGYLIAKIEEQGNDIKHLVNHAEKMDGRVDALEKRVESKFNTAETSFKIFKFLGLAAIALLTLKFGDITRLWHYFFS